MPSPAPAYDHTDAARSRMLERYKADFAAFARDILGVEVTATQLAIIDEIRPFSRQDFLRLLELGEKKIADVYVESDPHTRIGY